MPRERIRCAAAAACASLLFTWGCQSAKIPIPPAGTSAAGTATQQAASSAAGVHGFAAGSGVAGRAGAPSASLGMSPARPSNMGGTASSAPLPSGASGSMPLAGASGILGAAGSSGSAGTGATGAPLTASPEPANAWLMMGYDANNTYFNPNEKTLSVDNASQLKELWRATVDDVPTGSPVIVDGKVFVGSNAGVYAFDLETGAKLWSRSDIKSLSSFAYDGGFLYVHNYIPATMYKLKASDGTTLWGPVATWDSENISGESSPIIAQGKVIVGHSSGLREVSLDAASQAAARGGVEALDVETGQVVWTYYTVPDPSQGGENAASVWSSVSVDLKAGLVFATTGNNFTVAGPNSDAFHALDLATGARQWVKQVRAGDLDFATTNDPAQDTDFGANPILAEIDGRKIVAAADKAAAFWALDRTTGEVLWSRDKLTPAHSSLCGGVLISGAYDGQYFYVVSNDVADVSGGAVLHALDPKQNGASAWTYNFDRITWGAPSLANGLIVAPNDTKLYVMDAKNGHVLASFDTGGTIAGGAAAIAQGKIVVKSGLLYTADVKYNNQVICYGLPK
jgi:outer membrane protein assembly factor BamB